MQARPETLPPFSGQEFRVFFLLMGQLMDHLNTGRTILELVGGVGNIEHLEHCSTRLRLSLYDNSKVEVSELKKMPGIMGVVTNVQCQIVIGKDVVKVFDAIKSLMGNNSAEKQKPVIKKSGVPG